MIWNEVKLNDILYCIVSCFVCICVCVCVYVVDMYIDNMV